MPKTIELNDLNTSRASEQIKTYILNRTANLIIDNFEVYEITLDEVRNNFNKLSKVYRLLMTKNSNKVIFYSQK